MGQGWPDIPEIRHKAGRLPGIGSAELRCAGMIVAVNVEHAHIVVVGVLQNLAKRIRSDPSTHCPVIDVVGVRNRCVIRRQDNHAVPNSSGPTIDEANALEGELVASGEIGQDARPKRLANFEFDSHRRPRKCSARISMGRRSFRMWFQDQLCHSRSRIRKTFQFCPRLLTRWARNSRVG